MNIKVGDKFKFISSEAGWNPHFTKGKVYEITDHNKLNAMICTTTDQTNEVNKQTFTWYIPDFFSENRWKRISGMDRKPTWL